MLGKDENNEDSAYIGEAENIGNRLLEHIRSRDYWNEVIFFGSKDKYLNKASVRYLENRLHDLATSAGRSRLNQNIPTKSELSEAEQAELEEFLANIKILTSTLGHRLFDSLEETLESKKPEEVMFFCKSGSGAFGMGSPSTEGFVVFKASTFVAIEQGSLSPSMRLERKEMLASGTLVPDGDFFKLIKNVVFGSPSRAASMILARSASGPVEWKTEGGIPLKSVDY